MNNTIISKEVNDINRAFDNMLTMLNRLKDMDADEQPANTNKSLAEEIADIIIKENKKIISKIDELASIILDDIIEDLDIMEDCDDVDEDLDVVDYRSTVRDMAIDIFDRLLIETYYNDPTIITTESIADDDYEFDIDMLFEDILINLERIMDESDYEELIGSYYTTHIKYPSACGTTNHRILFIKNE